MLWAIVYILETCIFIEHLLYFNVIKLFPFSRSYLWYFFNDFCISWCLQIALICDNQFGSDSCVKLDSLLLLSCRSVGMLSFSIQIQYCPCLYIHITLSDQHTSKTHNGDQSSLLTLCGPQNALIRYSSATILLGSCLLSLALYF